MLRQATFVHGINTPADYDYERLWGPYIRRHFPAVRLNMARWPSTGTISGDCLKIGMSAKYRDRCRDAVMHGIQGTEDLLIGHSMGTVWLMSVLDELYESVFKRELPPVYLVGSPISHPMLRSLPGMRGLLRGVDRKRLTPIKHFFNRDDRVCALSGWADNPDWLTAKHVAVPGRQRTEHPLEIYLNSFEMQRAFHDWYRA